MASQNRSAGYCSHCQRGVTIIRPSGDGFLSRVRIALVKNDDTWFCSKCGNPASKSFAPAVEVSTALSEEATLVLDDQHIVADDSLAVLDLDVHSLNVKATDNDYPDMFCVAKGPEAICHLCSSSIPFQPLNDKTSSTCPECQGTVLLPGLGSESLLTSSPTIIKLEDDPERPAISKSLCTLCQFEMTYPKKLAGKAVDCPSCDTHFQLP